jgi:hypothetical protein
VDEDQEKISFSAVLFHVFRFPDSIRSTFSVQLSRRYHEDSCHWLCGILCTELVMVCKRVENAS